MANSDKAINEYAKVIEELIQITKAAESNTITKSLGHKFDEKIKEFLDYKKENRDFSNCLEEYFS